MNSVDIILAVPLLWAAYRGFSKGLIIEIASLLALILGIYGSIHFADYTMNFLSTYFGLKTKYLHIISFGITFLIIIIVIYTLAHLLEKLIDIVSLTFINKLGGAIFSIIKIAFILSVFLYFINTLDSGKTFISDSKRNTSILYKPVSSLVTTFVPKIKDYKTIRY